MGKKRESTKHKKPRDWIVSRDFMSDGSHNTKSIQYEYIELRVWNFRKVVYYQYSHLNLDDYRTLPTLCTSNAFQIDANILEQTKNYWHIGTNFPKINTTRVTCCSLLLRADFRANCVGHIRLFRKVSDTITVTRP